MSHARLLRLTGSEGEALRHSRGMAKAVFNLQEASLPVGHFFVDQFPDETSQILLRFLSGAL
jgi:hypothetical protein